MYFQSHEKQVEFMGVLYGGAICWIREVPICKFVFRWCKHVYRILSFVVV